MNQQWVPPGVPPGLPPGAPPGVPPIPLNNVPRWNQPRAPHNQYARPPNPPLPTRAPKPTQPNPPVPRPAPPSQPPPPKDQTAPPPPPPQEKGQPPPPPGVQTPKDPAKEKEKENISKLNLSAPPPPPPPEESSQNSESATNKAKKEQGANGNGGRGHFRGGFNHPGFGGDQGRNFFQDDNSEYDNGFESNFTSDNMKSQAINDNYGREEFQDSYDIGSHHQSAWNCMDSNCRETNFARMTNCRKCGKPKDCEMQTTTHLRSGDWKCFKCEEINFSKREKCRRCNLQKQSSLSNNANIPEGGASDNKSNPPLSNNNTKLENFDKMFRNWEENYDNWKSCNAENPDRHYVETYRAQMEAMRVQLLDKRKGLDNSREKDKVEEQEPTQMIPGIESENERKKKIDISAKELAQKILAENSDDSDEEGIKETAAKTKRSRWGNDEEPQEPKRSRWEADPADNINIQDWRRKPDTDNFGNGQREFNPRNDFGQNSPHQNFGDRNMGGFNNRGGQMFGNGRRGGQFHNPGGNWPRQGNNQPNMRGNMGMTRGGRGRFNPNDAGSRFDKNPDYENFWQPAAVTDYSANKSMPSSRRDVFVQREFKPETFDYSHGARQAPRTITNHRPLENSSWNNGPRNSPRTNQMRGSSERFQTPPPERHSPPPVKPAGNRIMIDSIINSPGRSSRPPKIVIILRGLPGSGKSHLGRLIKDKELEQGGEQPRILALDDYFDVDGKYEYDAEMEDLYRSNLIKSFKKNIDGGYFQFLIVDSINSEIDHFRSMWSHAKQNGFEVYVCDVECEASTAVSRNIHGRTEKEVRDLASAWEETPPHMNTLDARGLLQDDAIEHFEMGEASDDIKEDCSETSQPVDEEVRSRKTSVGSIRCLAIHKNNNLVSGSKCF